MNRKALLKMRNEADEVIRRSQEVPLNIIEHEIWRFLHNLISCLLEEDKTDEI